MESRAAPGDWQTPILCNLSRFTIYLFELRAERHHSARLVPESNKPNFCSATIGETAAAIFAFLSIQNGDIKMDQHDQELLSKQMRMLRPPENYGAIAAMLVAMFLIGITLGSALSEQQTEAIQIASMD
jgi:hypothetical protein